MNAKSLKKITLVFIILFSILVFSLGIYYLLLNTTEKGGFLNLVKDSFTVQEDIVTPIPTQPNTARVYAPSLDPSPIQIVTRSPSVNTSKDSISEKLTGPTTDTSSILLIPDNTRFQNGQTQDFTLFLVPSTNDKSAVIDYLKVEVLYNKQQLAIPETAIINTSSSGFGKILRVDTPASANKTGTFTLEMASSAPGSGLSFSSPVKLALIPFRAITSSVTQSSIKVGKTQAVGNNLKAISLISQETNYSIE